MIKIYRKRIKSRVIVITIAAIFNLNSAFGQGKHTQHFNEVWLGYFNQTHFSDKWGSWTDIHLRTKEDFFSNLLQTILRVGLTYYLHEDTRLTFGYAYVTNYPGDNHPHVAQPEHRPWQQIQWYTRYNKLRLTQSFRLEERFRRKIMNESELAPGYTFNYKLRYNFLAMFALSKHFFQRKSLSFVVNNDVHINFGKQIVNNYFDQNRFFLGFNYHLNEHDNLQFGYLNIFQQLAAGNQYKSVNAARINYFQNIDIRKTKKH